METATLLRHRLQLVYQWYTGMVNSETGMFEYLYLPQKDTFIREKFPIRDIASVWDAEMLSDFLNRHELQSVVEKSLCYYSDYLVECEGYLILDPVRLEEFSSIAHSAFMILALLHAPSPPKSQQIAALAQGILQQQRLDGSYKVYFHDLPDEDEGLYAGEAMLALLQAYQQTADSRFLQSVERGYSYYDRECFQRARVTEDILVFFTNWQSQACRLLFEYTESATIKQEVADYLYRMHDQIIAWGFYENIECDPGQQISVEVACALEGLNDAYGLAYSLNDKQRAKRYHHSLCTGLAYLLDLQCTHNGTERERGGFGLSLEKRMQRIDITGHAASAFMKSVANGIECRLSTFEHQHS